MRAQCMIINNCCSCRLVACKKWSAIVSAVRFVYKRDDRDGSDCILHIIIIASELEKKMSLPYNIID